MMDERRRYQREGIDLCPIHGRFLRPMTKAEWKKHIERKHAEEARP
jgi:hypothetical protein